MIIHMWMHWFWITATSFKGFLLFAVHLISLSCISHPSSMAEAGLLDNETFVIPNPISFMHNDSSQVESTSANITSLATEAASEVVGNPSPETTTGSPSSSPFESSPHEEDSSTEPLENESTAKSGEDWSKIVDGSTSDVEDTYNGGSLDVFQYPLKKFTKYSHIKYGKGKGKGKGDETVVEDKKVETVKIVEEKLNINVSVAGETTGEESSWEVPRNESVVEEATTTMTMSQVVQENSTSSVVSESSSSVMEMSSSSSLSSSSSSSTSPTEEFAMRDEPVRERNVTKSTSEGTAASDMTTTAETEKDLVEVIKNETLVIENKVAESAVHTTVEPFIPKTRVAAATSAHNYEVEQSGLNAGSITGITLGILVIFSLFGAVSFVLYRRRYLNKPQVLHDKCSNLDSSGYIDDASLRENSEEMYSLDNDSFLNSLEAMTIQNYWTESVKHTKL